MTNSEFSNTFDTLLNSYNTQAMFGDQASKLEVVLDEYEKSVLLTQAQDIIVKQYFDVRTDGVQEGFDGSERRQSDFSSLVTVNTLDKVSSTSQNVLITDEVNGVIGTLRFNLLKTGAAAIEYWKVILKTGAVTSAVITLESSKEATEEDPSPVNDTYRVDVTIAMSAGNTLADIKEVWEGLQFSNSDPTPTPMRNKYLNNYVTLDIKNTTGQVISKAQDLAKTALRKVDTTDTYDDRGIMFNLPPDLLYMLNEKLEVTTGTIKKKYVVIPINYREYDRQNSKPYSQPYKKQCWRLFQNIQGFDTLSEIIPIWDAVKENDGSVVQYKIRYVRRPQPIILVNLTDGLEIDGKDVETPCELNPIIHMDILNKAVELAIIYKGNRPVSNNKRED